jgi:hypothetical protein
LTKVVKNFDFKLSIQPPKNNPFFHNLIFRLFASMLMIMFTRNFKKVLQKKHNFLQNFPKFPVFGPFLGSGRVPPKSGQKWQKWWSTAIGLRTLGDGIGIYLVPENPGKNRQFWEFSKKVVNFFMYVSFFSHKLFNRYWWSLTFNFRCFPKTSKMRVFGDLYFVFERVKFLFQHKNEFFLINFNKTFLKFNQKLTSFLTLFLRRSLFLDF